MINPFTQFEFAFEYWVASVFGIYSEDFYMRDTEGNFTHPKNIQDPKYIQEDLTERFWQEINEGWRFVQPDMIEYFKELYSSQNT